MRDDDLRRRLDDLHDRLGEVDDETRDETEDLREHVGRFEPAAGTSDDDAAFVERLRRAALRFESSHPELSREIARVIDSLTAAGI